MALSISGSAAHAVNIFVEIGSLNRLLFQIRNKVHEPLLLGNHLCVDVRLFRELGSNLVVPYLLLRVAKVGLKKGDAQRPIPTEVLLGSFW